VLVDLIGSLAGLDMGAVVGLAKVGGLIVEVVEEVIVRWAVGRS